MADTTMNMVSCQTKNGYFQNTNYRIEVCIYSNIDVNIRFELELASGLELTILTKANSICPDPLTISETSRIMQIGAA